MFRDPLFNNIAKKYSDTTILIFVTLLYVMICAESDMYVPAFPQMIDYFGISENKIQLVLSVNFAGLCIAGLIAGPISDAYGRRTTLIAGLLLFVIGSIGCVYTDNFIMMLFWRLIQGIATSVPMVIGAAMFFDKYNAEKAGKILGVLNSFISASMAAAPIIGAWISEAFDWRANFVAILILGIISFAAILLIIEETLQEDKRKKFNIKEILKNYVRVLKSFPFIMYSIMAIFSFTTTIVYIANLSVIFINHIGMTLEVFSYHQA
jgi:DHA1 family bicyclomycin/chloramphenicol resistance-like MFS transporter